MVNKKYGVGLVLFFVAWVSTVLGQSQPYKIANLNNIPFADQVPGADAGTKIAAWIQASPATGGVWDARGLQGAQTIPTTVIINKPGTLFLPPPTAANFTTGASPAFLVTSSDVTIRSGKITLSGASAQAVGVSGTVANLLVEGMTIVGDGVAASYHKGIFNVPGQTLSNIRYLNNTIRDVAVGISINAQTSGSIDGVLIQGNHLSNIVGTASGYGYAIHCSNDPTLATRGRIVNNYLDGVQRHSIYLAGCNDTVVSGNTISNHRPAGIVSGAITPAVVVIGRNIAVSNNVFMSPGDGAIMVTGFLSATPPRTTQNIVVSGNVISNFRGYPPLVIGNSDPAVNGTVSEVSVQGNTLYQDVGVYANDDLIQVLSGLQVNLIGNTLVKVNAGGGGAGGMIHIYGYGEAAGTTTYTNNLRFADNLIHAVIGGSVFHAWQFAALAATSGIHADFTNNRFVNTAGNTFLFDAAQTDPNITVLNTDTSGLDTTLFKHATSR